MIEMALKNVQETEIMLISFLSGMIVTGIEISASRLLAPYFGTSLLVWTNVIGVVLISLSAGYYVGGKLSEKNLGFDFVYKIILLAGFSYAISPIVISPILKITIPFFGLFSISKIIIFESLLFSIILFSLPIFILGMINPFLIKIATFKQERVGLNDRLII